MKVIYIQKKNNKDFNFASKCFQGNIFDYKSLIIPSITIIDCIGFTR